MPKHWVRTALLVMALLVSAAMAQVPAAAPAEAQEAPVLPALPAKALDDAAELERTMPLLAAAVLEQARKPGAEPLDPGVRFRVEWVVGRHDEALASLHEWRALNRETTPGIDQIFVQYEVVLEALLRQARGMRPEEAYAESFRQVFLKMADVPAAGAHLAFAGDIDGFRASLRQLLEASRGKTRLTLTEALAQIRAYQVYRAYAALQPWTQAQLAADDARRYLVEETLVDTRDGARIRAISMRPRAATGKLPTLLNFSIYAERDWKLLDLRATAARGFAGVAAFTRGKLGSPGPVVPYEHDGADAVAVIDWISRQTWSDGRVGMYGGSYEGYTQWAAARIGHPALKAIMPSVPVAPGIDLPMEGGVFQGFVYRWFPYVTSNDTLDFDVNNDNARWQGLERRWYTSGRPYRELPSFDSAPNPIFTRWMDHPDYDAYWQSLTPQAADFARIDIPVLTTTGYYDGCLVSAVHYFRSHYRHNPTADHTLVVGPYNHWTGQNRSGPVLDGLALDPGAGIDVPALRYQWYEHLFRGGDKPALLGDRVNFQVMGADTWRHAATLEAMAPERRVLHFGTVAVDGRYALSEAPAKRGSEVMHEVDLADRSDVADDYSPLLVTPTLEDRHAVVFATAPYADGIEISGAFSVQLDVTANKRDFDFSLSLYEQLADGSYLQLSYLLARASHVRDPSRRQLLKPGKRQHFDLQAGRLTSRRLAPGSRLLAVLAVNKDPGAQVNLGSGKPVADETLADAGEPLRLQWHAGSRLEIPVRP